MTTQETALIELASVLGAAATPYMVIGGLANIIWGEPRATLDIDVTVWIPERQMPEFIDLIAHHFTVRVDNPLGFVAETRVLPVQNTNGVGIDVIFGMLPFEEEAIGRAVLVQIAGVPVRFCTAEDLILMKIISERERDLDDARAITRRRLAQLDRAYLETRVHELAQLLERPEIEARWTEWSHS